MPLPSLVGLFAQQSFVADAVLKETDQPFLIANSDPEPSFRLGQRPAKKGGEPPFVAMHPGRVAVVILGESPLG
jgi:hypothetical protein